MTWFTQLAFITMHLRLEQLKALETADLKGNSVPSIKKKASCFQAGHLVGIMGTLYPYYHEKKLLMLLL